jgi:hypothetical protein
VTVWGDYGRIERKAFMGIAQIRLDDLQLDPQQGSAIGWYKLFHSSSLLGAGGPKKPDGQTDGEGVVDSGMPVANGRVNGR